MQHSLDNISCGPNLKPPTGHYFYIESSDPRVEGDVANIYSNTYRHSSHTCKLQLWYSMNGANMGSLDVYLVTDASDDTKRVENLKWHKNGDAVSGRSLEYYFICDKDLLIVISIIKIRAKKRLSLIMRAIICIIPLQL